MSSGKAPDASTIAIDTAATDDGDAERFLLDFAERLGTETPSRVVLLDRGNIDDVAGFTTFAVPSYSDDRFNAADSILLQRICDHLGAGLYVSLRPTPLRTPMVLLVPGPLPSVQRSRRQRLEFDLALRFAVKHLFRREEDIAQVCREYDLCRQKALVFDGDDATADLLATVESAVGARTARFYETWSSTRRLQEEVDTTLWD